MNGPIQSASTRELTETTECDRIHSNERGCGRVPSVVLRYLVMYIALDLSRNRHEKHGPWVMIQFFGSKAIVLAVASHIPLVKIKVRVSRTVCGI